MDGWMDACMYVCIYMHVHKRTHACMYVCMHAFSYVYVSSLFVCTVTCKFVRIYLSMDLLRVCFECMYAYRYMYTCVCLHGCTYSQISMRQSIHFCVRVFIHLYHVVHRDR